MMLKHSKYLELGTESHCRYFEKPLKKDCNVDVEHPLKSFAILTHCSEPVKHPI